MRALAEDNEVFVHVYMKSSQNAKNNMEKRACWVPLPAMEETVFQSWSETRCKFSAWKRRQAHVWWKREREYHCCLIIGDFQCLDPTLFSYFTLRVTIFSGLIFALTTYQGSDPWAGFLAVLMILTIIAHFPRSDSVFQPTCIRDAMQEESTERQ